MSAGRGSGKGVVGMKRLAGLLGVLLGWAVLSACASGDTLDDLSRTLSVDL